MSELIPVTADGARERDCPMAMGYGNGFVKCQGPRCMAWRWWGGDRQFEWSPTVPDGAGWQPAPNSSGGQAKSAQGLGWKRVVPENERTGICGMVGPATVVTRED